MVGRGCTGPLVFSPRNWVNFYNDPKYAVLHLVAMVIIAGWAWEWAIQPGSSRWPSLSDARGWAGRLNDTVNVSHEHILAGYVSFWILFDPHKNGPRCTTTRVTLPPAAVFNLEDGFTILNDRQIANLK
jgi:hypothetical protein